METEYVPRAQYDAEIAALKAEIDTLRTLVSITRREFTSLSAGSGLESRVAHIESLHQLFGGNTAHRHPRET